MLAFVGKRLLALLPTLAVPVVLVFLVVRLAPGDPAEQMLGDQATPDQVSELRRRLGLDQSLWVQFGHFVGSVVHGDFGQSIYLRQPVSQVIWRYLAVTMEIALWSLILAAVIGVALGAWAAVRRDHTDGAIATAGGILGISIPQFLIAMALVLIFAMELRWVRIGGYVPWDQGAVPHLQSIFLPVLTLTLAEVGGISRMARGSLLDVLGEPFVQTARSQGIRERRITSIVVMRVAGLPIITVLGLTAASIVSGSAVIESIFSVPGMGRLMLTAIQRRDYPLIQGVVLVTGVAIIVLNLLVDVLYAAVDPRTHNAGKEGR